MMTRQRPSQPKNPKVIAFGIGLVVISLIILAGFGVWLARGSNITAGHQLSADAIIFIDAPGRIALDGALQVDGPAPVPVAAGSHTLSFFDIAAPKPLRASVKKGEFLYVPNPTASRSYHPHGNRGTVHVAAFPPDTTIEIPDCTPVDAKRPIMCKGAHTLSAELSPGTYTIIYSNPHLGKYQENFAIEANSTVRRQHSFITSLPEWNKWRSQHGKIIEQNYSRHHWEYRAGIAILLPFEAAGKLLKELFD